MKKHLFTRAVKRKIKETGRKRADIGESAGLSESHIQKWEAGSIPSVVNADALLRALGVRLVIGDPDGPDLEV